MRPRINGRVCVGHVHVCACKYAYVGRAYYARHSGTPELLRAALSHTYRPPYPNRLPRAVCYIIKNERCSETRSRIFAARTLSTVTPRHCLDNNAPRISNRSLECLVMPGDFAAQLYVVAITFETQTASIPLAALPSKTSRENMKC